MNREIIKIFEKAYSGESLSKAECISLLSLDETSSEAWLMRSIASDIVRKRNDNTGSIFGQIGLECSPCEGNCSFCSFAKDYTGMPDIKLDEATIAESTKAFTQGDDLYGLYLMTMAEYDLENYLRGVETVKKHKIGSTKLYTNVGDTSYEAFVEMKAAGIDGVYHCWRLGEGKDTAIAPETRKATIANARKAGLETLDALEPIGYEHTPEEMAEHIFFSIEMGTTQCGVMKRISVPGTPFENTPQISDFALSKFMAAMTLTMAGMPKMPWLAVHEPKMQGYMSGANMVCAETGVNPRDTVEDTLQNRGLDVSDCRQILKEAGFTYVARGDGSKDIL
ncbi:MAG: hypothetical protein Q4C25_00035 [Bacillota bacterium]|nr:hypothetical protein [Bacillota bacterium]